jgi:hypothetical protein
MHLTGLDLLFWAAGLFGHLTLLSVLWIRRRIHSFPLFTAFIASNIVRTLTLFLVQRYGTRASYFYTYWSLAIVDGLLQLGVVYELASRTFRPLGAWAKDIRQSFAWIIGWSIVTAAALTWLANPSTRLRIQSVMIRANFFSSALMSELFVGMIVLSVTVGLPWKTHAAKIAQGLGVYSVIEVIVESARSYFGLAKDTRAYDFLAHMRMVIYLSCLAYWIVMLWRDAPQSRKVSEQMHDELLALQGRVEHHLDGLRSRRRV